MRGIIDNLRLALGTLWVNPLRSLLTLLGIVIGVATVIAMMALIEGLRLKVNHDLASLGADVFKLSKWPQGFGRQNWQKLSKRPNLTLEDRDAILANCPSVRSISAAEDEGAQKVSTSIRESRPNVRVLGATPQYLDTSGIVVAGGRFITQPDELDERQVAVLGLDVADSVFPGIDPIGQEIRLRGRPFQVVGVLQRRGSFLGMVSLDNLVVTPLTTFLSLYGKKRSLELNVQAADPTLVNRAQGEVISLLRRRRNLAPAAENSFEVMTNDSMTKTFNNISQVITVAGFGVCLLSLIVGGIGILNIMLVSVTERTREIGIRKALGAKRRRILGQFATEAVVLSLCGGAIGIVLGFGVAFFGHWALDFPTKVPAWSVGAAVLMSSAVGLIFGIYPASRAARLDPVEAMRQE